LDTFAEIMMAFLFICILVFNISLTMIEHYLSSNGKKVPEFLIFGRIFGIIDDYKIMTIEKTGKVGVWHKSIVFSSWSMLIGTIIFILGGAVFGSK
jgi:hypothetical protein